MTLSGKVAWVTGGGSGIGLAGAQALAAAGASVVLSGRREEVLAREAMALGAEHLAFDVRDPAAAERTAATILQRHGRIDILVGSAGLNVAQRHWRDQTLESWDEVVRTNLDGAFYCIRAVLPAMRDAKSGLIITVASWAGRYTTAMVGAAYNAAKHAVVSMSESLNMEEGVNGVRACALCPGEVATPILDRRPVPPSAEERARMLQPEDVGAAIRWVAEQPPRVCVNEILISPTLNRIYQGF